MKERRNQDCGLGRGRVISLLVKHVLPMSYHGQVFSASVVRSAMIAVVNFRSGWRVGQKAMEIYALALSVLMNECVGIEPEAFSARISIGDSPVAKS